MAKRIVTYDTACYELAERFLSDVPLINTDDNRHELAGNIQRVIEDFIEYEAGVPRKAHPDNPAAYKDTDQ